MKINVRNIVGMFLFAGSALTGAIGTTAKYTGGVTQYGSYGLRKAVDAVLITTENIGWAVKETGKAVENGSGWVKEYADDLLDERKNEYRDLNEKFEWRGKLVEKDWVLVNFYNPNK